MGTVNLCPRKRVGTSRLTELRFRRFRSPIFLLAVGLLAFVDVSVALLIGASLGIPILLLGYAKDIDKSIRQSADVVDLGVIEIDNKGKAKQRPSTAEEKAAQWKRTIAPKSWLQTSIM